MFNWTYFVSVKVIYGCNIFSGSELKVKDEDNEPYRTQISMYDVQDL